MDAMTPWLLLIIAVLIVVSATFYYQLRQVESESLNRQSLVADELREAEAAFLAALDKLRALADDLEARRQYLAGERAELPAGRPQGSPRGRTDRPPAAAVPAASGWRARAVELARVGMTPLQIARELEVRVGEVELLLAFETEAGGRRPTGGPPTPGG